MLMLLAILIADLTLCTTPAHAQFDQHGDPLPKDAIARLGTSRFRHGTQVGPIRFTSDGKSLVSIAGGYLYLWEAPGGRLLRRDYLGGLQVFPQPGTSIVVGHTQRGIDSLKRIDLADRQSKFPEQIAEQVDPAIGNQVARLPIANETWRKFYLSPDGKILAGVSRPEQFDEVHLWKFEVGKPLIELEKLDRKWRSRDRFVQLWFSDDGKRIVALAEPVLRARGENGQPVVDEAVSIFQFQLEGPIKSRSMSVTKPTSFNGRALALSADGTSFALATKDRKILVYRFGQQDPVRSIDLPRVKADRDRHVINLCFSPDGKSLAAAGTASCIWLWEIDSGELQQTMAGHHSWVERLCFSPDGKLIASGAQDGLVRLWEVASGEPVPRPVGHEYWVFGCCFSDDGSIAATSSADGTTRIWDAQNGHLKRLIRHDSRWATDCEFLPGSHKLVTCELKVVKIHDADTGRLIWRSRPAKNAYCGSLSISSGGRRFAAAVSQRELRVWQMDGDEVRFIGKFASVRHDHTDISALALSPDGERLALSTSTNMAASTVIECFDIENPNERRRLRVEKGGARDLRFSRDGRYLFSAGYSTQRGWDAENKDLASENLEDSVIQWEAESGRLVRKFAFPGPNRPAYRLVRGVGLSPDGEFLVTAERNGDAIVYRIADGSAVSVLRGHMDELFGAAVSNDGMRCLTVGSDSTGLIWDLSKL